VWYPCRDLSRETSRHHWATVIIVIIIPIVIKYGLFEVVQYAVPNSIEKILVAIINGQGLIKTM